MIRHLDIENIYFRYRLHTNKEQKKQKTRTKKTKNKYKITINFINKDLISYKIRGKNILQDNLFICMKEAAEILGVDARTAKKILEAAEGFSFTRTSGKILINKNKLIEYINNTRIIRY